MLLVRIQPNRLAEHWGFLRSTIAASFPPTAVPDDTAMGNILAQVLSGNMQVWAVLKNQHPSEAVGILTTYVATDALLGTKSLLLFSLYAWEALQPQDYSDCFGTIKTFAKNEGCTNISFYSANSLLPKLGTKHGFMTEFTFCILQL